jgi:prepilin-type N-terminal cleavage/methylation domain-containing protein
MSGSSQSRRAFTLVELLVVIGIIAVLISLLLPALSQVRERSNRIKCLTNMKRIGEAMRIYAHDHKTYPRVLMEGGGVRYFGQGSTTDPFSTALTNDLTASYYLMVRMRLLNLEDFICPSTDDQVFRHSSSDEDNRIWANFRFTVPLLGRNLSYSFASPFLPGGSEWVNHRWSPSMPGSLALMADRNDGGRVGIEEKPGLPRSTVKLLNSRNHKSEGQNVYFADGHGEWASSPFVGYAQDNVFKAVLGERNNTSRNHDRDTNLRPWYDPKKGTLH